MKIRSLFNLAFMLCLTLVAVTSSASAADDPSPKKDTTTVATSPATGILEPERLMQAYMAKRAEWVALRQATDEKVRSAKTDAEKKQHRKKQADDEQVLKAAAADLKRQYRDAERMKRGDNKPSTVPTGN